MAAEVVVAAMYRVFSARMLPWLHHSCVMEKVVVSLERILSFTPSLALTRSATCLVPDAAHFVG